MRRIILALFVLQMVLSSGNALAKEGGFILSVWSGAGTSQTHAITTFEGPRSKERCEAAAIAMRAHAGRFNSTEYTVCIPY